MFLGMCAAAVLVAAVVLGGDLGRLGGIRLRHAWIVFAALGVQVLIISVLPDGRAAWAAAAHDLTYLAVLIVVALNIRLPGLVVIGAGVLSNGVAIAVNGGHLPASRQALAAAGIHAPRGLDNSAVLAHPHLTFLGDVMASPSWLPLRNTVSVGDVLLLVGAAVLVWSVARPWPVDRILAQQRKAGDSPERIAGPSAVGFHHL